jgi:UDP-N-acetylmuramoylalanine--D-glutamate ligase
MAERFADRTVLVCGVGVAGAPAARALLARGASVLLSDSAENESVAGLVAAGARFVGSAERLPDGVEVVVTSPGWRPDCPCGVRSSSRGGCATRTRRRGSR